AFLERELDRGLAAARGHRPYNGEALSIGSGKMIRPVMVVSQPVINDKKGYLGTLELVVDLNYLLQKLKAAVDSQRLDTSVLDRSGRLVASPSSKYATGQDMTSNELVKIFVEQSESIRVSVTKEYLLPQGKTPVKMLGTYYAVPGLDWAVVAQKTRDDAYSDIFDLQRDAIRFAMYAIGFSILISIWAARRLTVP